MILQATGIHRRFAKSGEAPEMIEVLKGISISAARGEFISLMGPSGSGKSTLLQILGALDRPSAGTVEIGGEAIAGFGEAELARFRRRRLGFIFQFFNLVPTLTALENVALPALLDGRSMKSIRGRCQELLVMLGVDHRAGNRPHQLSGGEMQRIAIARALLFEPELIFADEPTGNLDSATGQKVLETLAGLVRDQGCTLLMVTHDPKAASYGTRQIRIRDGRIESDTPT